jgi:hypothetical protein
VPSGYSLSGDCGLLFHFGDFYFKEDFSAKAFPGYQPPCSPFCSWFDRPKCAIDSSIALAYTRLDFWPQKTTLRVEGIVMENQKEQAAQEMDLAAAFGSDGGVSTQCFTVYVPNKDRNGQEIGNQRKWVLEAIRLLSEINGGATAMPPVEGGWLNDQGEIIWENPVLVYSFIRSDQFLSSLPRLREFLHRMGRETNQGEVAFEFDGRFYRIRNFDAEQPQEKP